MPLLSGTKLLCGGGNEEDKKKKRKDNESWQNPNLATGVRTIGVVTKLDLMDAGTVIPAFYLTSLFAYGCES